MDLTSLSVAFFQGLLSSLSACVYPLIPITTAIFGAGNVDKWYKGFFLSGIYVLGMSLTYMAIGLVAAFSGSVFGAYLGKPEVIFAFGIIFFYLGLGFMNILPLPIPNLGNKLQVKKSNSIVYPLILGIFSGFIAAPCTAPLFGSLLIHIAQSAASQNSVLPGVLQAFAFSIGMGVPFLLIGGFALKLPKPGNWLNAVKYAGGAVLIAASFHYLEDLVPGNFPPVDYRISTALIAGIPVFLVFLYLSRIMQLPENGMDKLKKAGFLTIAAFGLFLATAPFAGIKGNTESAAVTQEIHWISSLEKGMEKAKKENAPVFLDLWATWCQACHVMERELFPSEEFRSWVQKNKVVMIRLDFTEETPANMEITEKYSVRGLPTLIYISPEGKSRILLGYQNVPATMKKLEEFTSGTGQD